MRKGKIYFPFFNVNIFIHFNFVIYLQQEDFAMGDLFSGLLDGLDIFSIIFSVIGEIFFLLDIFVLIALGAAILRGIFKKFWKVAWRSIIFVVLFLVFLIMSNTVTSFVDANLLKNIKVTIGGTEETFATLGALFTRLITESGQTATYASAMSASLMKNVTMIIVIPVILLVGNLLAMLTFPLFNLLIPKKLKVIKLRVLKLILSIGMVLVVTMLFAMPFANIVPALTAIKPTLNDTSLLAAVFSEELIGVLEIFTKEKSVTLKILDSINTLQYISFFNGFKDAGTSFKLSEQMVILVGNLNTITV